jgi:fructoselysine 6-kinase
LALARGGKADLACVGDNCVDVALDPTPVGDPSGREFAGGNAFNVAVEMARLGFSVSYLGAVGTDSQAGLIIDAARAAAVDFSHVVRLPGATGRTVVSRDELGERQFVSEDYGVASAYRIDDAAAEVIMSARWAHFCRQPDLAPWAPRLRQRGTQLSCDLGIEGGLALLRDLAPHLEVVFLSGSAGDGRSGQELLREALDAGARLAVVTLGAVGSMAASAEGEWRVDAVQRKRVVDSLGAGDAYIAAFIASRLEGREIDDAMRAGAVAGANACTRWGLASPLETDEVAV